MATATNDKIEAPAPPGVPLNEYGVPPMGYLEADDLGQLTAINYQQATYIRRLEMRIAELQAALAARG